MVHYGSLRCATARYAGGMTGYCNYCLELHRKLTIVAVIERMSGPQWVRRACDACMERKGLKPWRV